MRPLTRTENHVPRGASRGKHRSKLLAGSGTALLLLLAAACDDGMSPDAHVNHAPDTTIEVQPPQTLDDDSFEVLLAWEGHDEDGQVEGFEYLLVAPEVPKATPTREEAWVHTRDRELRLVLPASAVTTESGIGYAFWVRAVDDQGAVDPSPASAGFSSLGIAPTLKIWAPIPTNSSCVGRPPALSFEWRAYDVDSKDGAGLQTRHALLRVEDLTVPGEPALAPGTCLTQLEYEVLDPVPWIPEWAWSDWMDYALDDLETRSVTLPPQEAGSVLLFVAQARDADGNKMRIFPWRDAARFSRIDTSIVPHLAALEIHYGVLNAPTRARLQTAAGVTHEIHWNASAYEYRGEIVGYRYAWDLQDPSDPEDPAWSTWDVTSSYIPPAVLEAGSHDFTLEAKDNSGGIARLGFDFDVVAFPARSDQKDCLLILDHGLGDTPSELAIRQLWTDQWIAMLSGLLPGFDAVRDVLDGRDDRDRIDLPKLLEYKSVIWFAVVPSDDSSVFNCFEVTETLDWLEAYMEVGGNLLLTGPGVMTALWSGAFPEIAFPIPLFDTGSSWDSYDGVSAYFIRADGWEIPFLSLQQAYRSWCLEMLDQVRPPGQGRFGEEPGSIPTSQLACDYLFRAELAPEFPDRFPSAAGTVVDLGNAWDGPRVPQETGLPKYPAYYKYAWEEFYDRDITNRLGFEISRRPCQTRMFVHRAARDEAFPVGHPRAGEPLVDNPAEECTPPGLDRSHLDGATNAVASSVYSETKPLPGSHDFLWGFHPHAFELDTVRSALAWILQEDWDLEVTP